MKNKVFTFSKVIITIYSAYVLLFSHLFLISLYCLRHHVVRNIISPRWNSPWRLAESSRICLFTCWNLQLGWFLFLQVFGCWLTGLLEVGVLESWVSWVTVNADCYRMLGWWSDSNNTRYL